MADLRIGPSSIEGTGCFAQREFAEDELIGEYTGERISDEEAERRYALSGRTYLFSLEDGTCLDAEHDASNVVKYINHSCDPNCYTELEEGRVFIRAQRPIAAGEELTFDYQLVSESDDLLSCSCGAKGCRGSMRCTEE